MPRLRPARAARVLFALILLVSLSGLTASAADGELLPVTPIAPPDLATAIVTLLPVATGDTVVDGGEDVSPASVVNLTATPRLPTCEYRDELTRYSKTRQWQKTLLDTTLRLPRSYKPWDLVSVSRAGIKGSGLVRNKIIPDLAALAAAARKAGKPLAVRSAYRSYDTQVAVFDSWVKRSGYAQALRFSARPGHSEHQLGTTVDFSTAPGAPLSSSFGESPAGKWLARNGWEYGFVMSYPKGQRRISCYGYEPWHWRHIGRDLARRIHESGQVPRRFLWENFEAAP